MDPIASLLKEPFTRLSRRFLDLAARGKITPAEFMLLCYVADKTVSWKRLWRTLSYTDIQDGTGLSRQKVRDALGSLQETGLLVRKTAGRSYSYALVPTGCTAADVVAAVDKSSQGAGSSVYSVDYHRSTHKTDPADLSFVFKKRLKKAAGAAVLVDSGLRGRASSSCLTCGGAGWVFSDRPDGTSTAAPCPCTGAAA